VRVILLGSGGQGVLMERLENVWDLPYFAYSADPGMDAVCCDVLRALAPDSRGAYFTVSCDLFEALSYLARPPTDDLGKAKVLLLEYHGVDLQAPDRYVWKDAAVVADLQSANTEDTHLELALEIVGKLLPVEMARNPREQLVHSPQGGVDRVLFVPQGGGDREPRG